jgi:hypothetical protein
MSDDYLDPDDQEVNEELDDGLQSFSQCKTSEDVWNTAAANGLTFPAEKELRKAIEDIKQLIYLSFFQTGKKERVHDMGVMKEYVNFLGLIFSAIQVYKRTRRPAPANLCNGQTASLAKGMDDFFKILYNQMAMPASNYQNELRDQFLELHFLCFPYCHTNQCLSMD